MSTPVIEASSNFAMSPITMVMSAGFGLSFVRMTMERASGVQEQQ